jgi:hypothetical protein
MRASAFTLLLIPLLLCACSDNAHDYGFEVDSLDVTIDSSQAQINSQLTFRLSSAAQLALERGIPLTLRIHFRARKDTRIPVSTIAAAEHVYKLSYLPLS